MLQFCKIVIIQFIKYVIIGMLARRVHSSIKKLSLCAGIFFWAFHFIFRMEMFMISIESVFLMSADSEAVTLVRAFFCLVW